MIRRGSYTQELAATLWEVSDFPTGASKLRPLAVYDVEGDSHTWDSWEFQGGVLRVSFGVDPVAGTLEYEYQTEGADPVVIEGSNGGTVSVVINQTNSVPQSQP